ncbi:MAG: hypothetical protein ACRC6X_07255 [Culicoidibacterales bacterium]
MKIIFIVLSMLIPLKPVVSPVIISNSKANVSLSKSPTIYLNNKLMLIPLLVENEQQLFSLELPGHQISEQMRQSLISNLTIIGIVEENINLLVEQAYVIKQLAIWRYLALELNVPFVLEKLEVELQEAYDLLLQKNYHLSQDKNSHIVDSSHVNDQSKNIQGPYFIRGDANEYSFNYSDPLDFILIDEQDNQLTRLVPDTAFFIKRSSAAEKTYLLEVTPWTTKSLLEEQFHDNLPYVSLARKPIPLELFTWKLLLNESSGSATFQTLTAAKIPIEAMQVVLTHTTLETTYQASSNIAGIVIFDDLILGEYHVRTTFSNDLERYESIAQTVMITDLIKLEQSLLFKEVEGTVVINFPDEIIRNLVTSLTLYQLLDTGKKLVKEIDYNNNQTEIIIDHLKPGKYILKQNQTLEKQRKDINIAFEVTQLNQTIYLNAKPEQFDLLPQTGEVTVGQSILVFLPTLAFSLTFIWIGKKNNYL